jgi:carbonic anhydrase/acetyltransferase-like protein (isoleucine patch superfamily)
MPILPYLDSRPTIGPNVRLDENAFVVGQVTVTGPAALGSYAVLRGDQNQIRVGPRFSIGRHSTVHVEREHGTQIGADVWVGDHAVVHACVLGDGTRVESRGLVLSTSRVGAGSVIAAGALVPEGAEFPDNSYISGTPGRRIRDTTAEERAETQALLREVLLA